VNICDKKSPPIKYWWAYIDGIKPKGENTLEKDIRVE